MREHEHHYCGSGRALRNWEQSAKRDDLRRQAAEQLRAMREKSERDTSAEIERAKRAAREAARLQLPHAGITARVVPYTNGRIWDSAGPLRSVPATATCKARALRAKRAT